uniref:alpha-E domain-containing protein n=1 Tax=Brachybacterium sp. GPGPB12 TaxID=3023517 RepID=UPI00404A3BDA
MPRDLGWDLTEIGRKIERTMSLLAPLRAALGHRRGRAAEERIANAVALITESGASYRRSFHAAVRRSAGRAAAQRHHAAALARLPAGPARPGPGPVARDRALPRAARTDVGAAHPPRRLGAARAAAPAAGRARR